MSVSHVECRGRAKRFGVTPNGTQRYRCTSCRKTFLAAPASLKVAIDGRQLRLQSAIADSICAMLRLGYSIREVSKRMRCHQATVRRYRNLVGATKCGCGETSGHRGWCAFRLAESPIRQSYYLLVKQHGSRILAQVRPIEHAVRQALPRTLPEDIREDLTQDLILLILSGQISMFEAKRDVQQFIRAAWRNSPQSRFGPISLDAALSEGETATLTDFLSDDGAHAQRIHEMIEAA